MKAPLPRLRLPLVARRQSSFLIQSQYDQPYSKILADTNRTTRRIWATVLGVALAIIFRRRLDGAARTLAAALFSLVTGGGGPAAA